jgi:hypothetical protein
MKPISILVSLVIPTLLVAVACGSSSGTSFVNGGGGSGGTGNGSSGSSNSGGSSNGSGAGSGGLSINGPGDGGAAGATETCGGTKLAAAPIAVNVLLVVDKSSSMTDTPDGFGSAKWPAMQTALAAAVDATKGSVAFGLDFFPNSADPSVACGLPTTGDPVVGVSASAANTAAIKQALTDNAPAGATPTAAALTRALDYFSTGAGAKLTGANYVLLATDGGPNCDAALTCTAATCTKNMDRPKCVGTPSFCATNYCDASLDPDGPSSCLDEDATVAAVQALAKAKIKTFVVGIPGSDAYKTTLNALATAGGVVNPNAPPSYFAVSMTGGTQALSDVLTSITTGLITTCTLKLSDNPPDYDQINVVIDGTTIAEGSADGWALDTSTIPPSVILKGATCQKVETTGVQQVDITFGCPTVHVK